MEYNRVLAPGSIRQISLVWIYFLSCCYLPAKACECGISAQSRIYEGYSITRDDYPWMASFITVERRYVTQCGATLISSQYLVTAGHCIPHSRRSESYVTFGTAGLDEAYFESTRHEIERFITKGSNSGRDIALVKLRQTVNIEPICLPSKSNNFAGVKATMLGFGLTKNGDDASTLQGGDVIVPSNDKCGRVQDVLSTEICGGNYGGGPAFCNGDSGGPLMYYDPTAQRWTIIGIVSASYECYDTRTYGTFTRVSSFVDWIQEMTNRVGCQL